MVGDGGGVVGYDSLESRIAGLIRGSRAGVVKRKMALGSEACARIKASLLTNGKRVTP